MVFLIGGILLHVLKNYKEMPVHSKGGNHEPVKITEHSLIENLILSYVESRNIERIFNRGLNWI